MQLRRRFIEPAKHNITESHRPATANTIPREKTPVNFPDVKYWEDYVELISQQRDDNVMALIRRNDNFLPCFDPPNLPTPTRKNKTRLGSPFNGPFAISDHRHNGRLVKSGGILVGFGYSGGPNELESDPDTWPTFYAKYKPPKRGQRANQVGANKSRYKPLSGSFRYILRNRNYVGRQIPLSLGRKTGLTFRTTNSMMVTLQAFQHQALVSKRTTFMGLVRDRFRAHGACPQADNKAHYVHLNALRAAELPPLPEL